MPISQLWGPTAGSVVVGQSCVKIKLKLSCLKLSRKYLITQYCQQFVSCGSDSGALVQGGPTSAGGVCGAGHSTEASGLHWPQALSKRVPAEHTRTFASRRPPTHITWSVQVSASLATATPSNAGGQSSHVGGAAWVPAQTCPAWSKPVFSGHTRTLAFSSDWQ